MFGLSQWRALHRLAGPGKMQPSAINCSGADSWKGRAALGIFCLRAAEFLRPSNANILAVAKWGISPAKPGHTSPESESFFLWNSTNGNNQRIANYESQGLVPIINPIPSFHDPCKKLYWWRIGLCCALCIYSYTGPRPVIGIVDGLEAHYC